MNVCIVYTHAELQIHKHSMYLKLYTFGIIICIYKQDKGFTNACI